MNIEWLRQLTLATRTTDLIGRTAELVLRETDTTGLFLNYDRTGWRLTGGDQSYRLDEDCLAARCALQGQAVTGQDGAMAWPVRQHGTMIGVWVAPEGVPEEKRGALEEILECMALLSAPVSELEQTRQALSMFQELAVLAIESVSGSRMGHTAQVCQLAADLCEFLDLGAQSRRRLWGAALYHDAGKVLLRESGNMDREMQHPEAGARFLEQTEMYAELAPLVAAHHRPYDPAQPASLEQSVLALAEDLVEFLTIQEGLAFEAKMAIFFQQNGRNHHPDVMDALAGLIDSGRLDRLRS